jgi:hypothetical protein
MQLFRFLPFCLVLFNTAYSALTQTTTSSQQPAQTVLPAVLTEAVARFGQVPPADSVVNAQVDITAGSTHESGTLRSLTRGPIETADEWALPSGNRREVFSENFIAPRSSGHNRGHSFEESLTAQSALFPLPWLAAKIAEKDLQIEDLGAETIESGSSQHLRLSRAWQSDKVLKAYAKFTVSDLWLDSGTGLPSKIAFERRKGWGAVPAIHVSIEYSDYRSVQGIQYPFHIKQYVNGTLWADIHVQDVRFNTGVAASEFSTP